MGEHSRLAFKGHELGLHQSLYLSLGVQPLDWPRDLQRSLGTRSPFYHNRPFLS